VVGAAPSVELAVKIARELQEKNLYVFMAGKTDGISFAEQLAQAGVELGWETRLVPFDKEVYGQIYSLGFATRAAMAFGGVQPGDYDKILRFCRQKFFAFTMLIGKIDNEKYATSAGGISYGLAVIAEEYIPQLLPIYSVPRF
jgi:acetyl-CoA synthase